jgi:hypothetical protein
MKRIKRVSKSKIILADAKSYVQLGPGLWQLDRKCEAGKSWACIKLGLL